MKANIRCRFQVGLWLLVGAIMLGVVMPALALKNVCKGCNRMVKDMKRTECAECGAPLNQCVFCNRLNAARRDFCVGCGASLDESRVLSTIATDTREALKLGRSPRAQQERTLRTLEHQIATKGLTAPYAYYRLTILQQMGWWSRLDQHAREFVEKFPEDVKVSDVRKMQAEALRRWGYMLYQQNDFAGAVNRFSDAVKIDPANKEAAYWLQRARTAAAKAPAAPAPVASSDGVPTGVDVPPEAAGSGAEGPGTPAVPAAAAGRSHERATPAVPAPGAAVTDAPRPGAAEPVPTVVAPPLVPAQDAGSEPSPGSGS